MRSIIVIWKRELKKYWHNKSRIIGSLGMPFFLLFIVGSGLNSTFSQTGEYGGNYMNFILPGIIGMVLLFSSVFTGVSVIWDKQFGFMKEMLVAPISRKKIMIGKTLGGATTSIIQAFILLSVSFILGLRIEHISGLLLALPVMFLIAVSFVAVGMAIASQMDDMHGFQLIVNFLIMPLFFLSGALFPIEGIPGWLKTLAMIDPFTYGVEALRYCFIGVSSISFSTSIIVLTVFSVLAVGTGTFLFRRMEI